MTVVLAFIVCSIATLLQVDLRTMLFPRPVNQPSVVSPSTPAVGHLSESENEFLLGQYDTAVAEIRGRIQQEHVLFGLKFSLVGAILALMFAGTVINRDEAGSPRHVFGTPVAATFCWSAVTTSAIIDARILYNADLIEALGTWIAQHVEPAMLQDVIGWEKFLDSEYPLFHERFYPLLRIDAQLLTLVIFFAIVYAYICVLPAKERSAARESSPDSDRGAMIQAPRAIYLVCVGGSTACFLAFFFVSIHFYARHPMWILGCFGSALIGACVSAYLWHRTWKRDH